MANIFRAPLAVARREIPPVLQGFASGVIVSLLVTVLGTLAMPAGKQTAPGAAQHPSSLRTNANTSQGSPKTLLADAQYPVGTELPPSSVKLPWIVSGTALGSPATLRSTVAPVVPSQLNQPGRAADRAVNPDTTCSTPKVLFADAQPPIGAEVFPATLLHAARLAVNVDTSRTATCLYVPVVTPPPFIVAPTAAWHQRPSLSVGSETSQGTAKALIAETQQPVGTELQPRLALQRSVGADTSQSAFAALNAGVVAPPFVPGLTAFTALWPVTAINASTSQGTAKALIADAQQPVGTGLQPGLTPQRAIGLDTSRSAAPVLYVGVVAPPVIPTQTSFTGQWPATAVNASTSQGTAKALIVDAQQPVGTGLQPGLALQRAIGLDTSRSAVALLALPAAPFVPASFISAPALLRLNVETSQALAKVLTADAQQPIGTELRFSSPQPRALGLDTSRSAAAFLALPAAPFTPASFIAAPLPRNIGTETSQSFAKALTADAQQPIGAERTESWVLHAPSRVWANTSLSTPRTLVIVLPPVQGRGDSWVGPIHKLRGFQPASTAAGSPKTLTADAQRPVGTARTEAAPQRVRELSIWARRGFQLPVALAGAYTPAASFYQVPFDDRTYTVTFDDRTLVVAFNDRTLTVPKDSA
jgi:hypothetical protein